MAKPRRHPEHRPPRARDKRLQILVLVVFVFLMIGMLLPGFLATPATP